MTRREKLIRDKEIATYLATAVAYTPKGRPVYPTVIEATAKFNSKYHLQAGQIFRIKKALIGPDKGVERHLISE